jgi:purine-nucleoside phosphorylase
VETGIAIKNGIYLQTGGPQYETPAEISAYRILGADAVGMSTACEAIAACHMGVDVCGISCITNMAAGITESALSHDEVKLTAKKAADSFTRLLKAFINKIPSEEKNDG